MEPTPNYPGLNPGYYQAPAPSYQPTAPEQETTIEFTEPGLVMQEKIRAWASEVLNKKDPTKELYRETFQMHEHVLKKGQESRGTKNKNTSSLPPVTFKAFINIFRPTTVVHVPRPVPASRNEAESVKKNETEKTENNEKDKTVERAILFAAAVVVLIFSTAMTGFFLSDYSKVKGRISDIQAVKLNDLDRQNDSMNELFKTALTMLNESKSAITWKLGISVGLFFSAVPLAAGAYMSAPALVGLGVLGLLSTSVVFTLRTAYTWDKMETKKGPGWVNWFPLNWVPKAEVAAAREILGIEEDEEVKA